MEKPEEASAGRADDGVAVHAPADRDMVGTVADQREAELHAREVRADLREAEQADRVWNGRRGSSPEPTNVITKQTHVTLSRQPATRPPACTPSCTTASTNAVRP